MTEVKSKRLSTRNPLFCTQRINTEPYRLGELCDNLTHNEIRYLQAKLSNVDFRSDPIAKLPFELCYQIFQHLEAYQIFQAQRVSRRWFRLLSLPEIVEPLTVRPWLGTLELSSQQSKNSSQRALPLMSGLSSGGQASMQARHIDSFRNGTAFSMARGKWQDKGTDSDILCHIDFAGSILAWTDHEAGCIQLRCVISGQGVSLYATSRNTFSQIAISDTTLVAMTVSGELWAWDLSDGLRNLEGQIPNYIETHIDENQLIVASEGVVVAAHEASDTIMTFTTWNIKTSQLYLFQKQIHQGISPEKYSYFVSITSGGDSIIFFERIFDQSKNVRFTHVRFTRMSLNGQIESSGCIEHPDIEEYSTHSEHAVPECTTGCVTLWSYAGRREAHLNRANTWEIMRVVYNRKSDQLELERHAVKHFVGTELRAGDFFWWNDVAYFGSYPGGPEELELLDLKASVCKRAEMSPFEPPEWYTDFPAQWRSKDSQVCLLGNESFLISVRCVHPLSIYITDYCTSTGTANRYVPAPLHTSSSPKAFIATNTKSEFLLGVAITLSGVSKT